MINYFLLFSILFFLSLLFLSYVAWIKLKNKKFLEDVWWLFPLGIYVWGDALVLLPFWLVAMIFSWGSVFIIFKIFLTFHLVRSFFEAIYWLNHQSVKDHFLSPLFRKNKLLDPKEVAIIYQLFHTVVVVTTLLLLKTF